MDTEGKAYGDNTWSLRLGYAGVFYKYPKTGKMESRKEQEMMPEVSWGGEAYRALLDIVRS